jgi:hypothetical protein
VVEVIESRTTNDELETLRFLVSAGKVLEQININLCGKYDGLIDLRRGREELLVRTPKASNNLQILVWTRSHDGPYYFCKF